MKRRTEPEESIEPCVDGLANFFSESVNTETNLSVLENRADYFDEADADAVIDDEIIDPTALVFGISAESEALMKLAAACGFKIKIAQIEEIKELPASEETIHLANFNNIVKDCNIERNTFVCIFIPNETDCELILSQCLASDAYYIGLAGNQEKVEAVLTALKEDGAPDTELAAIAAPMGLNVGAADPDQHAVAIVAEMLAAKTGKLKRLRYGNRKI